MPTPNDLGITLPHIVLIGVIPQYSEWPPQHHFSWLKHNNDNSWTGSQVYPGSSMNQFYTFKSKKMLPKNGLSKIITCNDITFFNFSTKYLSDTFIRPQKHPRYPDYKPQTSSLQHRHQRHHQLQHKIMSPHVYNCYMSQVVAICLNCVKLSQFASNCSKI